MIQTRLQKFQVSHLSLDLTQKKIPCLMSDSKSVLALLLAHDVTTLFNSILVIALKKMATRLFTVSGRICGLLSSVRTERVS